jgi:phosphoserine aminotransferase
VVKQLKLKDTRVMEAPYGEIPDLSKVDFSRDVVFTWNGTTSGVCVPNGDWIPANREGLTICDATSAAFAMDLAWDKLDVVTYSWQKVMGGEGAHGVLILSPRAVARLESHSPAWPMPKIFRMTKGGKLIGGIFEGETINTPSMLVVEDTLDGLKWGEAIGGLPVLIKRSQANLAAIAAWVDACPEVAFLAADPKIRSNTSVCLRIVAPWFAKLDDEGQQKAQKAIVGLLDKEGVAYDIGAYRDAPAGLRIWAGATVETADLKALFPWIEWALAETAKSFA